MLLPLIIHITQLENPNLFQQARSHWWTQRNSWTQTPSINPNHNRKKKKKRKRKTQFNPNQNPYTVTARSMFPPSLINPNQPPKSHRNKNPNTADQPDHNRNKKKKKKTRSTRSKPRHRRVDQPKSTTEIPPEQKPRHRRSTPITTGKKKKTQINPIKTQTPPRWSTQTQTPPRWSTQNNHQNPTGTKPRHRRSTPITTGKKKKKKTHIKHDQNPETAATAAARSTFPPSLINPDQHFLHCDVLCWWWEEEDARFWR